MFDLNRYIEAQDSGMYELALEELKTGNTRSHYMWFIFPQIKGLGSSEMSVRYYIRSLDEAIAYLNHRNLGKRLVECTNIVNNLKNKTIYQIFPSPDDMKFKSSMTLFAIASEVIGNSASEFHKALELYCNDKKDKATIELLDLAN